jgi:hypothetical protein
VLYLTKIPGFADETGSTARALARRRPHNHRLWAITVHFVREVVTIEYGKWFPVRALSARSWVRALYMNPDFKGKRAVFRFLAAESVQMARSLLYQTVIKMKKGT